ncbi:MAG TPA: hypothetical protein VKK61_09870, partial [Tepidisphaeraceae bacterium]|nr:hypothetical protein [Tepidisphaeraceae bacterium]
ILLAVILIDVAVRRIAWDWLATKRAAFAVADYVRSYTTTRKVESKQTLDALRRVREETTAKPQAPAEAEQAPDRSKKFEASGVEGNITDVVGGATNKAIPPPPKKPQPKGGGEAGGYTGSLLEAKRRAQQQIKKKEEGNE